MSITGFSDSGCSAKNEQLRYICGVLIDDFRLRFIYHVLSWSSHNSKRPVLPIGAAEIIASREAIYKRKILEFTLSTLLDTRIPLHPVFDRNHIFNSFSTKRNRIYKPI